MHMSELAAMLRKPGIHSLAEGIVLSVSTTGTIQLKTGDQEKPFSPGIRPKIVAKAVNGYVGQRLIYG